MGRILAIDYGKMRTGIAVTDPLRIIASPLATMRASAVIPYLKQYLIKENVEGIVIGYPRQMNNQESETMKQIRPFVGLLMKEFPDLLIEFYDERFTTKMVQQAVSLMGIKTKQIKKERIDQLSAVIILQDYLESKR